MVEETLSDLAKKKFFEKASTGTRTRDPKVARQIKMKKHDPDRHKRPVFPVDFSVMPCLVERSHENSPVSTSSRESLSIADEPRSPVKLSPRASNSPKLNWSPSPPSSPKLNGTSTFEAIRRTFDDFGFEASPLKSKSRVELKRYIERLEEKNKDLEEDNKTLHDEMFHKIKFLSDLQQKYDECIDTIVELNSKIYQLENGCNVDSSGQTMVSLQSSQAKDREIAELKMDMEDIEKDSHLWRVRCNLLDVDNDSLKTQIAELEQTIIELRNGNGGQSRPTSNSSKSKLSNRVRPKTRNLQFDQIMNKPEKDASLAIADTDNLKQCLPSMESKRPKRPSLAKTTDTNTSGQTLPKATKSSTNIKELRSNTPYLPPIECLVGSKYYPKPPSHPNPKLQQASTRSSTPICNPVLPTDSHFKLPHLPFPPSKPKTNKTRKYIR
ncbi:hypothetical protein LOTGIDRAFT_235282 [Lottia gigantea]|uniref:Uncharacterized protein n=1 Tax=Lottia gigantea TaxID=225164 RepID=V4BDI6_LOTGI|nr:hypothetical protein LOTGIDRAFT_235282 [Lottia gigantea]ESO86664.1 hypothetical protein LOTGIDRAFT_235282 [Lottia gigantea]